MDLCPSSSLCPSLPSPAKVEADRKQAAAAVALAQAKALLCAEDSIMDPGIVTAVRTYIKEQGAREGGKEGEGEEEEEVMNVDEMLAQNYRGKANMALLLSGWLEELGGDGTEGEDVEGRELVLEHLRSQVKGSFDVEKADALLFGRKQEMSFIDEMMTWKRWRRTLMEIFAANKESKLLGGYCMQHLSRAGHNTEMADLVSVDDYWSVARGVLTELLLEVPWADHVDLGRLVGTLTRICCGTAYLHSFSQEVLRKVEVALMKEAGKEGEGGRGGGRGQSLVAATRKFRRIRQELERGSWEAAEGAGGGEREKERGSRSRFVHRLSAWQAEAAPVNWAEEEDPMEAREGRRRLVGVILDVLSEGRLSDQALAVFLEAFVDSSILFKERNKGGEGKEYKEGEEDKGKDGDDDDDDELANVRGPLVYLRHPQLLDLLVKAIFDPKKRLDTASRRASACQILTVASTALFDGSVDREEADALYQGLRTASTLLADEEMLTWNMSTSSMPPSLKGLLRAHPVVAMGFLHWLRVTIQDPEFHNSRQFNEVMSVLMRLLQFLVTERPLHHPAIFEALKALLTLKPTESSFNIIKMKRQALQCCVFLMSRGFVLPVLAFFHRILPEMDHALVRYFVGVTLVAAQPPYSPVFARALASLLREVVVRKALKSNLDEGHKGALLRFIETVCAEEGDEEEGGDEGREERKEKEPSPAKKKDAAVGGEEKVEGGVAAAAVAAGLLDPAMRKGLRLVYAYLLKKERRKRRRMNGEGEGEGGRPIEDGSSSGSLK
eukprot:evm.model.NODE_31977_length_99932_cov_29.870142.15